MSIDLEKMNNKFEEIMENETISDKSETAPCNIDGVTKRFIPDIKKVHAKRLVEKFGVKANDVVDEIILYITNGEPDFEGKSIYLQELQNEINAL